MNSYIEKNAGDIKYVLIFSIIGLNAVLFFSGAYIGAFLSTTFICGTNLYFGHSRDKMLDRTFAREKGLLDELEKITTVLSKLPEKERYNFQKIMRNL